MSESHKYKRAITALEDALLSSDDVLHTLDGAGYDVVHGVRLEALERIAEISLAWVKSHYHHCGIWTTDQLAIHKKKRVEIERQLIAAVNEWEALENESNLGGTN